MPNRAKDPVDCAPFEGLLVNSPTSVPGSPRYVAMVLAITAVVVWALAALPIGAGSIVSPAVTVHELVLNLPPAVASFLAFLWSIPRAGPRNPWATA